MNALMNGMKGSWMNGCGDDSSPVSNGTLNDEYTKSITNKEKE